MLLHPLDTLAASADRLVEIEAAPEQAARTSRGRRRLLADLFF